RVVGELAAALDAVRTHPQDGVVWQTGDESPSSWLLKVSGGAQQDEPQRVVTVFNDKDAAEQQSQVLRAEQVRQEEAERTQKPETVLPELKQEEAVKLRPDELNPTNPGLPDPDAGVLASIRENERSGGREQSTADRVRRDVDPPDKSAGEQSRASHVVASLADAERNMIRAVEQPEHGRMPEHEEQTLSRTIQKER
ncbi:conjugative transfer relaxase/helicase TraI domain-containing protein, partial [Citrobacter gillenii]